MNEQEQQRRTKLDDLRKLGQAYPNDFKRDTFALEIHQNHGDDNAEALAAKEIKVIIAGRLLSKRVMGKASFANIRDVSGDIQILVKRDGIGLDNYAGFKLWDIGDIVGVVGEVFRTQKGELSVRADNIRLLVKSLKPLPEKWHGLADQETRYRQRYVDLIVNERSRWIFKMRSQIIQNIRNDMLALGYMEVETPMLQSLPGGAAATPFITHHNTLDIEQYLRVAPELSLKRLVVGGFERVFEINRNFRNEGLSTQHNPEFTMLEFYQAFADCEDVMAITQRILQNAASTVIKQQQIEYGDHQLDFVSPFNRISMHDAILQYNSSLDAASMNDRDRLTTYMETLKIPLEKQWGLGKLWLEIFEKTVEHELVQPTFITGYPKEVSPLSRSNDEDEFYTDRFELFIAGKEVANGFSELNDPDDQAERFKAQVANREAGDQEALHYDHDYIRALEYGLPPSGGVGVGIDRLVMILTNSPTIRDVILFPQLRPEA